MGKSIKIPGRLESAETGNIVAGANAIKDDTRGKTQLVVNNEVEAAILSLAEGKQNVLTFDQTPTEDSTNPVTSGGVYAADKLLSDAIEAILLLIPSSASALNKLVDLATMNSSIATATASFKGTYNLVSDLHLGVDATHAQIAAALDALSLDADNNDYAFVQVPNTDTAPTEINKTERYKFNGTNWAFEYDLNNSGFTSAQWNAINSGITELLVSKLSALPTNEALVAELATKQDNLTFDNLPTSGSNNPVKSGGVYTRNSEIVAMITALDAAKQNVLTFDNTPTVGSSNPVKSGGVYFAISALQATIVALDAAKQDKLTFDSTPTLGSTNPVTSSGIKTELNRIDSDITTLDNLYRALTQSALVVVQPTDTWPVANPNTTTIYRVVDRTNTPPQYYSDYMWNGTTMVLMAQYDNAIDDVPEDNSNNLVKSSGIPKKDGLVDVQGIQRKDIRLQRGVFEPSTSDVTREAITNGMKITKNVAVPGTLFFVNFENKKGYIKFEFDCETDNSVIPPLFVFDNTNTSALSQEKELKSFSSQSEHVSITFYNDGTFVAFGFYVNDLGAGKYLSISNVVTYNIKDAIQIPIDNTNVYFQEMYAGDGEIGATERSINLPRYFSIAYGNRCYGFRSVVGNNFFYANDYREEIYLDIDQLFKYKDGGEIVGADFSEIFVKVTSGVPLQGNYLLAFSFFNYKLTPYGFIGKMLYDKVYKGSYTDTDVIDAYNIQKSLIGMEPINVISSSSFSYTKTGDVPGHRGCFLLPSAYKRYRIHFDYLKSNSDSIIELNLGSGIELYTNDYYLFAEITDNSGTFDSEFEVDNIQMIFFSFNSLQTGDTMTISNFSITPIGMKQQQATYDLIYPPLVNEAVGKFNLFADGGRIGYIWLSDLHLNSSQSANNEAVLRQVKAAVDIANRTSMDFIVIGGDLIDGQANTLIQTELIPSLLEVTAECNKPVIYMSGNHDDNGYSFNASYILTKGQRTDLISHSTTGVNAVFPNSIANYFYFDLEQKGARVVCLDYIDCPNDKNGTNWWSLSEDQVKWFIQTISSTDKKVIVLTHGCPNKKYADWGLGDEGGYNTDLMNVISAYNSRNSITLYGNIYDFSSAQGNISHIHAGHTHFDVVDDVICGGVPCLITSCLKTQDWNYSPLTPVSGKQDTYIIPDAATAEEYHWNDWGYEFKVYFNRTHKDARECVFDVVSVNSDAIHTIRVGQGDDRNYNI